MDREEREELLSELLNPELEMSRRTEIAQQFRTWGDEVDTSIVELTETKQKLQKEKDDLIVSNSKLFRQLGVTGDGDENEIEEQEFSESVTLESIEQTI